MWEDCRMDPNGSHPKRKDSNRFDLFESFLKLERIRDAGAVTQRSFFAFKIRR
jgi:hypothetical protein